MSWIVWATLGYFLNAVAVTVDKALLSRRELGNPAVYTLSVSALGLLVLVLAPWGLAWPSGAALGYGLLSGTCFTVGLWLMFILLQHGEASRVPAFIGSLSPVFVFLGAYLLTGELLSVREVVAFVLLVGGGFTMVGGAGGLRGRSRWLAVASAVAFALAYVSIKLTFDHTTFISGLVWTRVGGFLSSLLLFAVPGTWSVFRGTVSRSGGGLRLAFLGGQIAGALAGLLNSYAITLGSVTLVNAIQGTQYVFLLLIAGVVTVRFPGLFRDEFSPAVLRRKVSGTVLVVLGLILLA